MVSSLDDFRTNVLCTYFASMRTKFTPTMFWFHLPNNIWRRTYIKNLHILNFSKFSCYFPLTSEHPLNTVFSCLKLYSSFTRKDQCIAWVALYNPVIPCCRTAPHRMPVNALFAMSEGHLLRSQLTDGPCCADNEDTKQWILVGR